jgi:hypothetical protein
VIELHGRPFNYQWLYCSDFLRSVEARDTLLASLEWRMVAASFIGASAYLLISIYLGAWIERRMRNVRVPDWAFTGALIGTLVVWLVLGQAQGKAHGWPYAKLVNPVYEFAQSWVSASWQPALFTMRSGKTTTRRHVSSSQNHFAGPLRQVVRLETAALSEANGTDNEAATDQEERRRFGRLRLCLYCPLPRR